MPIKKIKTAVFFFGMIWRLNKLFLISIVFQSFINWLQAVLSVVLTRDLMDSLNKRNLHQSILAVASLIGLLFISAIISQLLNTYQTTARIDVNTMLHSELGQKYAGLPLYITQRLDNQELYQMAIKCVDGSYAESYVAQIISIISNISVVISLLYILRYLPVWLYILLAIALAVDIVVYLRQANLLYANYVDETPIERSLYYSRGRLMRTDYAKEIRLYGLRNYIVGKTESAIEAFFRQCEKTSRNSLYKIVWTYAAEAVQYIGIYVLAIHEYFSNTSMTIGDFSMVLTSTLKFSSAVHAIASNGISIYKNLHYIEMYESFLKLSNGRTEGIQALEDRVTHRFNFNNVAFRYDGTDTYALQNVNLAFDTNEKISIVGENGAGKTTFIMLLLRFLKPTEGCITVDGIDINNIDIDEYLKLFSPIFQDFCIYSTTIQENIILSQGYDEKRFMEALTSIGLDMDKFVECIMNQIGDIYDENSIDLSGGERQKLALARALYKPSKMLILDEPTAALDPRTEFELYSNFSRILGDRGAIFVSHRLASCRLCEHIFVFKNGTVAETGSHENLMREKGEYYSLFTAQSENYFSSPKESVNEA